MSDELDDDVRDLLNMLDSEADEVEADEAEPDVTHNTTHKYVVPEFVAAETKTEEALKPIPIEVNLDNTPALDMPVVAPIIDMAEKSRQVSQVTESVLADCTKDRQQAQDVIDMLMKTARDSIDKFGRVSAELAEQLIKAVQVKSDINANAIKMVDSNIKLIAATKSGNSININNTSTSSINASLTEILSQPHSDSDY